MGNVLRQRPNELLDDEDEDEDEDEAKAGNGNAPPPPVPPLPRQFTKDDDTKMEE